MKIISLHFKNLNSLKGEFKIDFTSSSLANAGLFAITGPTGAGKSTILDAITLALYSYTPRLGMINKNAITEKGVIVTKHTKDAFAHIEFEVNNIKYKAEWAIAFTNRGNWGDVKHKLNKEESGVYVGITQNTSTTVSMVNEIIGIDKEQFTKAIVLSQGKFDEFLTAKEDVRYELLEIITGTDIYRKIGVKVYEALRLKNEEVKAIDNQLGGIEILTDEQINEIETNKAALEASANELKLNIDKLNALKQLKDKINSLVDEKAAIESALIKLETDTVAFRPYLVKLAEHEKAMPLQVEYNNWKDSAAAIILLKTSVETNEVILLAKQSDKEQLLKEIAAQIGEIVTDNDIESKLASFVARVSKLDNQINELKVVLEAKVNLLNTLYKQIPAGGLTEIKPIQKSVKELEAFLKAKDIQLSTVQLPKDFNGIDFEVEIDRTSSLINTVIKAQGIKENLETLIGSKNKEQKVIENFDASIKASTLELNKLKEQAENLEKEMKEADALFKANQTLMGLDEYRDLLEDGTPCPCCGSTIHPYATAKPKLNVKLEADLQAKLLAVEKCNASIRAKEKTLIEEGANKVNAAKYVGKIETEIDEKQNLFNGFCKGLTLPEDTSMDILNALHLKYETNSTNLKAHKIWNETKQPLSAYIAALANYDNEKVILEGAEAERTNIFSLASITDYNSKITLKWNNLNRDIVDATTTIDTAKNSMQEKQTLFDTLQLKLSKVVLEFAFESIDAIGLVLLSDTDYQKYTQQKTALANAKASLDDRSELNTIQYNEAIIRDDATIIYGDLVIQTDLQSIERDGMMREIGTLKGLIQTNTDNLTRVADIQARREEIKVEQSYYKTLADLIGDAEGDKFNKIVQRITLRHLFNMTNQKLSTLMDRYQVDLGTDKYEDAIWVIDTYMGDERRVIDSVSGGERFVISLAMALSLSDLASNNVRLDSVFIDEGFGSLSPEDLDNAISMLERLQVENEKTIGIISHVESLKERISTQIVVEKLQNGESTLSLKSNGVVTSLTLS
jgi:exonuclease SbcC